jgi:hypothetical protein
MHVGVPRRIVYFFLRFLTRARGGTVGWGTALQAEMSRVRFPMVSLQFSIEIILPSPVYGPGVDSASNGNEYQEYILG